MSVDVLALQVCRRGRYTWRAAVERRAPGAPRAVVECMRRDERGIGFRIYRAEHSDPELLDGFADMLRATGHVPVAQVMAGAALALLAEQEANP